jgi:hypothetical protein
VVRTVLLSNAVIGFGIDAGFENANPDERHDILGVRSRMSATPFAMLPCKFGGVVATTQIQAVTRIADEATYGVVRFRFLNEFAAHAVDVSSAVIPSRAPVSELMSANHWFVPDERAVPPEWNAIDVTVSPAER